MTELAFTEEQMVSMVRNALLVAGQEMGEKGDHWPVIKSTVYSVMRDWEELKTKRNVHAEMRKHIYAYLDELDQILLTCSAEAQKDSAPKLKEMREIYDAWFDKIDRRHLALEDDEIPAHFKRAGEIIKTLED